MLKKQTERLHLFSIYLMMSFFLMACSSKPTLKGSHSERPQLLTVAVLPFENNSINPSLETAGLARSVTDHISGQLADSPQISLIDRESIELFLQELSLSSQGLTGKENRLQLGKLLGARYLLMGEFTEIVGNLRIDGRVVEVQTGTVTTSSSILGLASERRQLEQSFSKDITKHFLKKVGGSEPRKPMSSRGFFRLGQKLEKENRNEEALKAYQKALSMNPENYEAQDRMDILLIKSLN